MGLQENIGLCKLRRLRADGLWPPALGEDLTDPMVSSLLAFLTEDTVLGLNRLFAHAHQFETVIGERREIQYRDVDNNTVTDVATVFDHFVLNTFDAPLVNFPDAPTEVARVVPTAEAEVIPTPPSVAAAAVAMPSAEAGAGNFVSGKLCE